MLTPECLWENLKRRNGEQKLTLSQLVCLLVSRVVPVKDIEDYLIANPLLAAGERELRAKVMAGDWKELDYSQLKPIVDKVRTLSTLEENNQFYEPEEDRVVLTLLKQLEEQPLSETHSKQQKQQVGTTTYIEGSGSIVGQKEDALHARMLSKLRLIFKKYLKANGFQDGSESNEQAAKMDIRLFMLYYKQFQVSEAFPAAAAYAIFRKLAVHSLWLPYDGFLELHLRLFGLNSEGNLHQSQRMERWKQVHQLLSAKKIRKMLNLCGHGEASRVVKEHSGKFKHDIIESLEEKATLRKIKIESKRRGNEEANISRIPFPNRKGINNFLQSQPHSKSQSQSQSQLQKQAIDQHPIQRDVSAALPMKQQKYKLPELAHSQSQGTKRMLLNSRLNDVNSIQTQLKLPKLRVHQLKQQSIYRSLEMFEKSCGKQDLSAVRLLANAEEQESFLECYLGREKLRTKKTYVLPAKKIASQVELPPMRFS